MNTRYVFAFSLVASLAVAAACGSTSPESTTPTSEPSASETPPPALSATATASTTASAPTPVTSSSSAPVAAPATWKEATSPALQAAFMKANIKPQMSKVFQDYDAKKYAEFNCVTCHGPKFQTPKDFLPKLTLAGGKFAVTADKAGILKFMGEKVVPEMAKQMGEKPFDPATKTGFGCGGCHTIDMK
jgi:hypothetical protein